MTKSSTGSGKRRDSTDRVGPAGRFLVSGSEEKFWDLVNQLRENYLRIAKIEDEEAKEDACLHLALAEVRMQIMAEEEAKGALVADKARTWPTVSKEIRTLRADLGINGLKEEFEL